MAQIHVLDSATIDKIAAGEVVERPSSVVKELVENAIDAGATAITVEAKDGGIEFLRVTDNGSGMEPSQIRTAFLRHATSKIASAEDLVGVTSLGFRGEALSSIAAVSRVEVITKTRDCLTGVRFVMEGAQEKSYEEIGAPEGTTFLVRNLFYNTPVRRKFLKTPATEGGYIAELMEHLALSRPDISMKFILGNQVRFHTSGNGDLREVIYRLYGRDIASRLIAIQEERNGVRIEGYLGRPELVRSNRGFEIYFMNRRFIRSQLVAKALEEGYREYLMQHKFPLCILHIDMEGSAVDVNVHPTKMDVRFSDAPAFCSLLAAMVRENLKKREMIPEATLSRPQKQSGKEQAADNSPEPFEKVRGEQYRVQEEMNYRAAQPAMRDVMDSPLWNRIREGRRLREPQQDVPQKPQQDDSQKPQQAVPSPGSDDSFFTEAAPPKEIPFRSDASSPADPGPFPSKPADSLSADSGPSPAAAPLPKPEDALSGKEIAEAAVGAPSRESVRQLDLFEDKILTGENRSRFRVVGQVFNTYWIVQFEEKLLIIDQHAAHEKVKYERLMKQYREKQVVSQNLFPPIILSLSVQEEAVLKEHREVFASLGFEIEAFGGNEYALRSVPTDLYGCSERELFLEVLDELAEGALGRNPQAVGEKIASMSCKAAVKGNNRLSISEAEKLIDELLTLDNPYNCPHGRPTMISLSRTELEKKFKRIV